VTGKAGKFSFLPLLLTLGSGMGLLALATIITDIIVLNVMKKKNFYKKLKELNYKDEVKYQRYLNSNITIFYTIL